MLTVFESLFATHGEFLPRATSSSLVRWLSKPTEHANKDRAKRWGAFRSVDGRRRGEDIIEANALVFDIDRDAPPLDVLVDALADVHAFIASTWSATELAPRWRVVVFVSRPIVTEEFSRVQRGGIELLERAAEVDRAALDVGHLWSSPAMQPGGFFACRETQGALLDVDAALDRFPPEQRIEAEAPAVRSASRYARGALASAIGEITNAAHGERNHTLNRAAFPLGRFVASGELDEAEVIEALVAAARAIGLTERESRYCVRRALRQKIARSA